MIVFSLLRLVSKHFYWKYIPFFDLQQIFSLFLGKAPRKTALKKNFPLEEEKYFTALKAIDDAHSKSSGVDFENFKKMANSLEATLKSNRTVPCAKRRVLISHLQLNFI